ncbi:MAG: DUF4097 family beta strand repeat-containing protein [Bacteroidetes bacterium]|nr:DUF4097 family beta strand repeat-containing protein [Bacteroidota bacterium]
MKTVLKITIIILLVGLAIGMKGASINEYTRVIKKEFSVSPDAQLTISNKFGGIHCSNWDKNVVGIEVKVVVDATNDNTAAKMLEKINVNFNSTTSLVEVTTVFDEMNTSGRNRFQVDYTINLPSSMSLDLSNKFGDIYINEASGKTRINLSYGSLDVNKLNNSDNLIDLKFCNSAKVRSIKGAVINLKYSTLDIDYAGSLRLDSKFSNLNANKIIALNVSFEGGAVDIKNSSTIESRSKFSDMDIERIEQSLSLDIQYGSCSVRNMGPDFTSINIKNKYADVDVRLPESAVYSLDATLKYCELHFPESNSNLNYRSVTPTSSEYRGVVGSKDAKPKASVVVRSDYGSVSLK